MRAPSTGYRRLALATAIATFALIIVGGIVRVSDSGLGCGPGGSGFHGWPFCNGDVVPGLDLNHIIEYTHRALAGVVGILIVTLAVQPGATAAPPRRWCSSPRRWCCSWSPRRRSAEPRSRRT